MVKVVINIPCLNEEKTLPVVLSELPTKLAGVAEIEVLVVDDGSTDNTAAIARKHGCIVVRHKKTLGLGTSFKHGMEIALERGADIFVNTDGDNQYPSRYIHQLIQPLLNNTADIAIGNRRPWKVRHFSPLKRVLQFTGNYLVRSIAGAAVPDTVSGFRAYNREALLRLNVTTKFSYVLDTIVQAAHKGLTITSIPIETNAPTRSSRLFKNMFVHMRKSAVNVLRCYVVYKPFHTFCWISSVFFIPALILFLRFFYHYLSGRSGYIQSLIIAGSLTFLGGFSLALGVMAELQRTNRMLVEEQLYFEKKHEYSR